MASLGVCTPTAEPRTLRATTFCMSPVTAGICICRSVIPLICAVGMPASYDRPKTGDLSPALGYPGGPCQVVQRIQKEVRNPRLRDQLIEEIEHGDSLSNPEAAKVYDMESERGVGIAKRLLIGPHTQYRMDLRGITVPLIRLVLGRFLKQLNDWKSQKDHRYVRITTDLARNEPVEFTDPRLRLTIVFASAGSGAVKLVTTYWKGERDPKMPNHGCKLAQRVVSRYLTHTSPAIPAP